jgi:hypothetical protein
MPSAIESAPCGGQLPQPGGFGHIAIHPPALVVEDAEVRLGRGVVLVSGQTEPLRRLGGSAATNALRSGLSCRRPEWKRQQDKCTARPFGSSSREFA